MSTDETMSGWQGPHAGQSVPSHAERFVDRIQDEAVRSSLASYVSTNGLYGNLDQGARFDDALRCSMALAVGNRRLLDSMVKADEVPEDTWPESVWHIVLDSCLAGERPDYEPGRVRKWLAKTILRQEVPTRKWVINLSPWRERSPTSSEGIL